MPAYFYQAIVRALMWWALAACTLLFPQQSTGLLLTAFFGILLLDAVAAGLGDVAFGETIARVIPEHLRGRTRGWRGLFGAAAGALAGLMVHQFAGEESSRGAFAALFAVAGLLYLIGGAVFRTIHEPPDVQECVAQPWGELLPRATKVLADRRFLRFAAVQALLVPISYGLAFFTLLGRRDFGLQLGGISLLIIVDAATPAAANWLWGSLADRRGNRLVMLLGGIIGLAAPAAAFGLLYLGKNIPNAVILALFGVIVVAIAFAVASLQIATKNYVLELAPTSGDRPLYIGISDLFVGIPCALLALAGWAIDHVGFIPIFALLTLCTLAAIALTLTLPPVGQAADAKAD